MIKEDGLEEDEMLKWLEDELSREEEFKVELGG